MSDPLHHDDPHSARPPHEDAAAHSDAAHGKEEHAAEHHAKPHKGHGKHHGEHAHEGGWIVTYCDMITLLMAFFICLLTFASQHVNAHKRPRKGNSLIELFDGEGMVGPARVDDLDGVVWRELPVKPHFSSHGTEMRAMYSDPVSESTAAIMKLLDEVAKGTLSDSYVLRVPLAMLFDRNGKLTSSGAQVLRVLASNLRPLPYELHLQVADRDDLRKVLVLAQHLTNREEFHPSRLGIGLRDTPDASLTAVWITFVRRT